MKIKNKKRAQQEIVGFAVIMIIVIVAGIIFLGIYLRKDKVSLNEDAEVSNFLSASLRYTTDCARDYEPKYRSLRELSSDCYSQDICLDKRKSCDVLNATYSELLRTNWIKGDITAYKIVFYYKSSINDSSGKEFMTNSYGNMSSCAKKITGNSFYSVYSGGYIETDLSICEQA